MRKVAKMGDQVPSLEGKVSSLAMSAISNTRDGQSPRALDSFDERPDVLTEDSLLDLKVINDQISVKHFLQ